VSRRTQKIEDFLDREMLCISRESLIFEGPRGGSDSDREKYGKIEDFPVLANL
jgi:hypothetical protein